MAARAQRLGFPAMALVALVIAHNLVFLLAYGAGYEEALAHSGHGDAWQGAVVAVLAGGLGLFVTALWRLHRLRLLAGPRRRVAGAALTPSLRRFLGALLWLWLRLTVVSTSLFVIQENVEHAQSGEPLPGLGVLGSAEYPHGALVVAGIALAVAFVGGLLRWSRALLVARITAARSMGPSSTDLAAALGHLGRASPRLDRRSPDQRAGAPRGQRRLGFATPDLTSP